MIRKEIDPESDVVRVTFELPPMTWADTIHLVGEFNQWNRTSLPMARRRDDENWHLTIDLPRGREYQFRYLINGTDWYNDWDADRHVPNPFGGDNSVVVV